MNKILTAMLITDYANKTRLKPVLFSNIVHMILSVYALDEESFKEHLHLHNEQNVAHLQITGKPITSEDINNSSVKMFPMMIKIDDGSWVESEDIKISERDKFLWWWVDYLCYSVDIKKNQPHILQAISTCAMLQKKNVTKFTKIDQIFLPSTVKDSVNKKDIVIFDPTLCLSDATNNLFLSYIDLRKQSNDDDTEQVDKQTSNIGKIEITYDNQPLNVLLLAATHNFLSIPKKDLSKKVFAESNVEDPTPIIDNFFQIIKEYSVSVISKKNEQRNTNTNLCNKLQTLLKQQDKMPKMRAHKPTS